MAQRGVSYAEIWECVEKFFPWYVKNNVMEGYDDRTILSRANPYESLNLNYFLRPILCKLEKKEIYNYDILERKIVALMEELKNFHNWRTDSLITYFHNSLLKKTRKEIDFIQKYIVNMQVIPTENIFELHDYRTYRYIDIPPLDYCDLNMYFLNYFPELLSEYKHLVLNYFGDDTNAGFTYSVLLASYLSNHINDKMIHSKITDFFNKVVELPNRKEGISPIGLIMGNGTGVVSRLKKQNINIDYTI